MSRRRRSGGGEFTSSRGRRSGSGAAVAVLLSAALAAFGSALPTVATAASPKVEDTLAQRVQACTGCHGPQGRAGSDGYYPRLAGKPADYLYHQLLAFRDGRRRYAPMNLLLAPLSDAYLREIAGHFSALEVPYPPPQPAGAGADALARGQALALHGDPAGGIPACVQCHGPALMGVAPGLPALLGLPRDYLNAQLGAWRTGSRHALAPDCMAQIAQRLRPDDLTALAHWLAAQPVPAGARAAERLPRPLPLACGGVVVTIGWSPAPGDGDDLLAAIDGAPGVAVGRSTRVDMPGPMAGDDGGLTQPPAIGAARGWSAPAGTARAPGGTVLSPGTRPDDATGGRR